MSKPRAHLLDASVLIPLLDHTHIHNRPAEKWFSTPGLPWAMCALTEGAVLRFFLRPEIGYKMTQVNGMLECLKQRSGYRYQPISTDWQTLTEPFFSRLHGHKQVTDAFLLGLAIQENLLLTTFDQGIMHLAGQHREFVRLLESA